MRFSLALIVTIFALVVSFAAVVTNAEVQNEETSRNLRVGIINLKDGSRSAKLVVQLDDDSNTEGSTNELEITKPAVGDSASTEERFVATASWAQALKTLSRTRCCLPRRLFRLESFSLTSVS
ncbi:hypothetical protein PF005_g27344 [Phytophthora fragariae]|uniref:RxLR effector protein n=1 Tax=Phytophthora fragariae TaxID=53985 RepID=A0A6A3W791_9STRA|nr:hypothetical protein PF003_g36931 [Phytophthora fragariae]KAE8921700.1 hypothetical protein PF009_g28028 [Phytophthora fragariae]KAE8970858.1 hypothetical protein PF011_g26255 [Phytophthora fragariae]KAE9068861.1 hypothetical protein PF010_g26896 [Phytophthora fragariae]KAE9069235.1 hypothetical protein PF007_g27396 [Phytophthora fragariae]